MVPTDLLEFHAFCLTDTGTRLDQYAAALAASIQPGDRVVDLGAGLGVLGILACRAGASRVLAIESSAAADLGRALVARHGYADRITFVSRSSFDVATDVSYDVLMADVHAPFGLQEHGLGALLDARARFLRPGGRMLPRRLELFAAPVEADAAYARRIDPWRRTIQGISLDVVLPAIVNRPHPARLLPSQLLAPLVAIDDIDLQSATGLRVGGTATFSATRPGTCHGVCVAFRSTLADGVSVQNLPGDNGTTNFAHAWLPLDAPLPVAAGDRIAITVDIFDGVEFRWRLGVDGGAGRDVTHSTLFAWPIEGSALARERDDYRPRLSERGRVARELMGLFDGTRTATALRAHLDALDSSALPSEHARATCLRETIARYG